MEHCFSEPSADVSRWNITARARASVVRRRIGCRFCPMQRNLSYGSHFLGPLTSSPSYANVDMYDAATGLWSSIQPLSLARTLLCATSLPKQGIAIFAGGGGTILQCPTPSPQLISLSGTTTTPSDVVDIFNAADASSRKWSTAKLKSARWALGCASLPQQALAFFGGGQGRCNACLVRHC